MKLILDNLEIIAYAVSGLISLGLAWELFNDVSNVVRPPPEHFVFIVMALTLAIIAARRLLYIIEEQ